MANFYLDNPDIQKTMDMLGLAEVAALQEDDFSFAGQFDFAPSDAVDAIDNYKRALCEMGEIAACRIAPGAEDTDRRGNALLPDGTVEYAPGTKEALSLLAKSGLCGATIPYRLGGLNMPCTVLTALNDILSRADASLMNIFGLQGIAETINSFADEDLKQKYVPRLASGEFTGAMVLTEPDAGSDLQSVKTKAWQNEKGEWFVSGVKRFITNGCADVLVVLARTEPELSDGRGLSCLLVERCPEVRVRRLEHKLGINGSPTCELVFDNAPAKLIGQRKRGLITYVMALMNGARVGISAQSVGISEAAYRAARSYARERRQFGKTIDSFPAVRHLLSESRAMLEASRLLSYYASMCVDMENGLSKKAERLKGTDEGAIARKRCRIYASFNKLLTPMAKYFCSEASVTIANNAVSVLGGSGYMKDYPCERLLRDARITNIYEGTSQLQVIAALPQITSGVVPEVIGDILAKADGGLFPEEREILASLLDMLSGAVAFLKEKHPSDRYLDLHARELLDASAIIVAGALFVRYASFAQDKSHLPGYFGRVLAPKAESLIKSATAGYDATDSMFGNFAPDYDKAL